MRYIEDFKEDENVVDHYLCKEKKVCKTKAGKTYYSLKLQDKTGTIEAKVWEVSKDIQNFEEGDYIKIDGTVLIYQSEPQLKISKIRKSQEGEYVVSEYISSTAKNVDALYDEIVEIIKTLQNPHIKKLAENIIINNENIRDSFKTHSAAKSMHHNYLGGLIEHTYNVVSICDFLSTRYKFVNRDILIVSALLHDICKISELSAMPQNDYTDEGQLLGHIILAIDLVNIESKKIDGFPDKLLLMLKHCILAHHGEMEFGSPKEPKTIEAMILHLADNMDAKIRMFEDMLESNSTNDWVGYHKVLARNIRRSDI